MNSASDINMPNQRLFIANPLPDFLTINFQQAISNATKNEHVRWLPEKNWHLTGLFLGEVAVEKTNEIINRLQNLSASLIPYSLKFEKFQTMPNLPFPKMVWARFERSVFFTEQVKKTKSELHSILDQINPIKKPIPHVTLARVKRGKRVHMFNIESSLINELWQINQFELWESKLLPDGAEYRCLEKFPFKLEGIST